ncbi:MAG: methylmalonyl-CoA carboxyltransferase [Burkholderiales bacterium]|nr:methylmalonyl-CoA carboxyltransferase [Burkholderiales bacterium]
MSWRASVEELQRRRALVQRMGAPDKVQRQRAAGKLTVRERIAALLDEGSFREIGSTTGQAEYDEHGHLLDLSASNFVFGRGRIAGRPVVVGADDFTVRGGASDGATGGKLVMSEQMAHELRLPLVRLIDASGGSVRTVEAKGRTYVPANPAWDWVAANLATVPVVSLVLGSVAGFASARAVASHYSVMVAGQSHMFIAGPPVVARTGRVFTKDELGSPELHARAGAIDDVVASEAEAFAHARRFLSYLPDSVDHLSERIANTDPPDRCDDRLIDIVPTDRRKVYKMREIVERVVDAGSFFEMGKGFGASAITGLARLDGRAVAVLASDPYHYGGAWTADAAQKITRFVDLAETFHLPVVHFVDIPGFLIGPEAERAGTIRHGARALSAVYQATVPWCSILVRKVFGVAGAAHTNASRLRYRYAWPSGDWGSLPIEGGIEAAYRSDIEAAPDPAAKLAEITERLQAMRSPFRTAETFGVEEIIDPRETRPLLCEFAERAAHVLKAVPARVQYRP